MKTVKIMSDGNIARVGMIVSSADGIAIIKRIKTGYIPYEDFAPIEDHDILVKPINYTWNSKLEDRVGLHFTSLCLISKATTEQKKLYWLELEKQTIQFRPEFETKLKELGIRDKFVNNLFDPKWLYEYDRQHYKKFRNIALSTDDWYYFINYAFYWGNSPEGHEYWLKISQK